MRQRFTAYGHNPLDWYDRQFPEYRFQACLWAANLIEAREIARQLAPDCTSFLVHYCYVPRSETPGRKEP